MRTTLGLPVFRCLIFSTTVLLGSFSLAADEGLLPKEQALERGNEALENGDLDLAVSCLTEAIRLDPKYVLAYGDRGEVYRRRGDFVSAMADFDQAIQLDPKYVPAYNGRGEGYLMKGDFDRAVADFTEAIRLAPKLTAAYNDRGKAYQMKGDSDRAIADFTAAIQLDPKYVWAYHGRSGAYRMKGDFEHAIADLTKALQLDPKYTTKEFSKSDAGDRKIWILNDLPYAFRWCPAGTFTMGSPVNEKERRANEKQHPVTFSQGFWMLETPVTQEMWESALGSNPSHFHGKKLPVEQVSWNDCLGYIQALNHVASTVIPAGYQFSLPTEAQWEYACRAGTTTPFNFGNSLNGDRANCKGTAPYGTDQEGPYLEQTTAVDSYPMNAWGLCDMHGNVWEWCADGKGDYPADSATDPVVLSVGSHRVLRGGGWNFNAAFCRSAYRHNLELSSRNNAVGLRLVLVRAELAPKLENRLLPKAGARPASSVRSKPPSSAQYKPGYRSLVKIEGATYGFHWCPAGEFKMGSLPKEKKRNNDDDEKRHNVILSQGFWMQETEVTQALWKSVMKNNPSQFPGDKLPVETVSWDDCQAFIKKLNSLASATVPAGYQFSLPTEAQWEYACRAGTTTTYSFGNAPGNGKLMNSLFHPGNGQVTGRGRTTPVGFYPPNVLGLYDMHGNVWEWCSDWYGNYPNGPATDPTGPDSGSKRVCRGGCWSNNALACRSACRSSLPTQTGNSSTGFRLVLVQGK